MIGEFHLLMDYRFINHAQMRRPTGRPACDSNLFTISNLTPSLKACAVYFGGGGAQDMGFEKLRAPIQDCWEWKEKSLFAPTALRKLVGAQSMGKSHEHEPCGKEAQTDDFAPMYDWHLNFRERYVICVRSPGTSWLICTCLRCIPLGVWRESSFQLRTSRCTLVIL